MPDQDQPKRRHGCFFYGCLIGTVCLGAVVLALLLGLYQVRKMIFQFTDSQPLSLPAVQMSPDEMQKVQHRFDDFCDAVRNSRRTPPLALTGDELNALLATEPGAQPFKGKLYVSLENDHLQAQVSLRLSELGLPFFKGRYLNGTGVFDLSLRNGTLWLLPQSITVKDKPLPAVYMNQIRRQNLAQGVADDPHASAALGRLQSIEIKDGKLILVPKQEQ